MRQWQVSEENKTHLRKIGGEFSSIRSKTTGWKEFLRRARSKGKEFDLTIEDLKEIWERQNGKCPYTGWMLELPNYKTAKTPKTASLDRIDSSRGYVKDNVQFVSVMANYAKCDFSENEMREFCNVIAENSRIQ
jgi:hypothetical protein